MRTGVVKMRWAKPGQAPLQRAKPECGTRAITNPKHPPTLHQCQFAKRRSLKKVRCRLALWSAADWPAEADYFSAELLCAWQPACAAESSLCCSACTASPPSFSSGVCQRHTMWTVLFLRLQLLEPRAVKGGSEWSWRRKFYNFYICRRSPTPCVDCFCFLRRTAAKAVTFFKKGSASSARAFQNLFWCHTRPARRMT